MRRRQWSGTSRLTPLIFLHSPGPGSHLYTGVEGWFTLKVVHDDAVVAVDDVLVDALPPEVLQNLVDAVDAVQDGLDEQEQKQREEKNTALLLAARLCRS